MARHQIISDGLRGLGIGHIKGRNLGLPPRFGDILGHGLQFGQPAPRQHHTRARSRQCLGRGLANAAPRARYPSQLSVELRHVIPPVMQRPMGALGHSCARLSIGA